MSSRLGRELGRLVRSHLSSSTATGVEWCFVTALLWLRVHYLAATAAGAVLGAAIDFALKRHWAFRRAASAAFHREAMRYLVVSGCSLLLNLGAAYALVDGAGLPSMPGVILASVVVGFLWNYPMHRLFVFRSARAAQPPPDAEVAALPPGPADSLDEVVERIARA